MKKSAFDAAIGDKIRMARVEKRISQQTLADHIGLTQHAISQYEQGTRSISLHHLVHLARELEKPLSYFLDFGDEVVVVKGTRLYDMIKDAQSSAEAMSRVLDIYQFHRFLTARKGKGLDWKTPSPMANSDAS